MATVLPRGHLIQAVLVLAGIWFVTQILFYGRDIFIPVITAAFVSILLVPVVNWLEQWMGRTLAAVVCVACGVATISLLLLSFITFQIVAFYQDIPKIQSAFEAYSQYIQNWLSGYAFVDIENYMSVVSQWVSQSVQTATSLVLNVSTSIVYVAAICVFFIFYVVFFLMYRHRFLQFMLSVVPQGHEETVRDVVFRIQGTVSQYLIGVITVIALLAVYNMIVLHLLAVPYASLWALVSAILYIIPYIGITIGAIFPAAASLFLQQDPTTALLVIGVFVINQVIENNILTPYIVGGRVQINPLFVLLAFFAGGQIWGIAGMILFLPLLSVVKVVCDQLPILQPYGYLLGTNHATSIYKDTS